MIGSWTDELTAHKDFGDLFAVTGKVFDAARHYIWSGSVKEIKKIGRSFPEAPVIVTTEFLSGPSWEVAAAYRLVEQTSDLIPDDNARQWLQCALADIAVGARTVPTVASDPYHASFGAAASLASLANDAQAAQLLDLTDSLIPRGPKNFHHTDDDQVKLLITLADRDDEVGHRAFEQLCRGLITSEFLGNPLLKSNSSVLSNRTDEAMHHLANAARDGHFQAALALVIAGGDSEPVAALARKHYEQAIQPRQHVPGQVTFGSDVQSVALLVSTLGEIEADTFASAMLVMAHDVKEPAMNRETALHAVGTVARKLSADVRAEMFNATLAMAGGKYLPSSEEVPIPDSGDPFDRFKFNFGGNSVIEIAALRVAALLADEPARYEQVQQQAEMLFASAGPDSSSGIDRAISYIPSTYVLIDPARFVGHPRPMIRAIAAVKWAEEEDRDSVLGERFSRDPSAIVRRSLAMALSVNHPEGIREILKSDVRRSVRDQLGGP